MHHVQISVLCILMLGHLCYLRDEIVIAHDSSAEWIKPDILKCRSVEWT